MATTITQKGRVTIPKKIREFLGIRAGEKVTFKLKGKDVIVEKGEDGSVFSLEQKWKGFGLKNLRGFQDVDSYLAKTRGRK